MTPTQLALADSAVDLAADVANTFVGINQARINRQFNREEAQKARDWSYKMWQLQNEYDSPSAKIQRLVAAGLNPNLAYGSLDAMGNPVGTSEQAHFSSMPSVPNFGGTNLLQARLAEAQIERLETQNANDSKMTEANISRLAYLNDVSEAEVRKVAADIDLCKSRNQEVIQGIENMKQQWSILDEQKKQAMFETAYIAATQELKIAAINEENRAIQETAVALAAAQVLNIKADTAMKWAQTALNKEYANESRARVELNSAQMRVAQNQAQLISAQIINEGVRTESLMFQMTKDKSDYQFFNSTPDDNGFVRTTKTVLRGVDAACRMFGQILHGTVVHRQ